MTGGMGAAFREEGAALLRWLLIIFLYFQGILACGNIQEVSGITVFFSSGCPTLDQAEAILSEEEKLEQRTEVCFFQNWEADTLKEKEYGRNARILAGGICGNAAVYDWRLRGFASGDDDGCVIDRGTAQTLFGSAGAEGREVVFRNRIYQVRLVIPWNQGILLYHPSEKETGYIGVCLGKNSREAEEDTVSRFLLRHGLTGSRTEEDVLKDAALAALWGFPAALYLSVFLRAFRQRKGENSGIWTGICFLMAGAAFAVLWKNTEVSTGWLPARWSDFQFWSEKTGTLREQIKLSLFMPGTALKAENLIFACRSMVLSLAALFLYLLWGRKGRPDLSEKKCRAGQ